MSLLGTVALAAGASDPGDVRGTLTLFLAISALLAAFFVAVILLTIVRKRRRSGPRPGRTQAPLKDPWREAGRRAKPYRNK